MRVVEHERGRERERRKKEGGGWACGYVCV